VDEETLRRLAIWRFEQGDPPQQIWTRLGRSRRWFFKWLARYRAEGSAALAGRSRAHRSHPASVSETVRAKVRAARERHPSWGERTIARELRVAPSHATVGRILRSSGHTRPRRGRLVPDVRYPRLVPAGALELVEYDFFGPRWIKGHGRVMGFHAMDVFSRAVCLGAWGGRDQASQIEYWCELLERFGVPAVVQTDNEFGIPNFGLARGRPLFTRLTRFFIAIGIEHRFIPVGEPFRNGHIERFNRTYRYDFYDRETFRDLAHLRRRQRVFERFFNERRRHGGIGYTVPLSRFPPDRRRLAARPEVDLARLGEGRVTYVRRVTSEGEIVILNGQTVGLDPALAGEYVSAVVHTPGLDLTVVTVDGEVVPARRGAR
jgi:transposase InsO family protein